MKYRVNFINGETVYTSARTGRTLTGSARKACEEAREQEAINEAVENALILDWYKENATEIDAEQERMIARCNNQPTHGKGFTLANTATVTIWPSAFGQGFTRAQAHMWLKEIRAKRYAERRASMKRTYNTAHKTHSNNARAVSYVARKIFGAKAIREGRSFKIVFTRHIQTMRDFWEGMPPRACGRIGALRCADGKTRAWVQIFYKYGFIWTVMPVSSAWEIPTRGKRPPKGGKKITAPKKEDSTQNASYEAFCDKIDAIIHADDNAPKKRIAITGWAFTATMLRNIEAAYESDDVKYGVAHTFRIVAAQFVRNSLACMGWKYNADRGMKKDAVIDFLNRRDTEKFPIFTSTRYDLFSTLDAIQAVNRCMLYAMKETPGAVVATKETRPILARLCRKLIHEMREPIIND